MGDAERVDPDAAAGVDAADVRGLAAGGGAALAGVRLAAGRWLASSGSSRGVVAVTSTRGVMKADMPLNDACPDIRVDPDTFKVWIDGDEVIPDPARELPSPSATPCSDGPAHAPAGRLALPLRVLRALARPRAGGRRRPDATCPRSSRRASGWSPRPTRASRSRRAARRVRDAATSCVGARGRVGGPLPVARAARRGEAARRAAAALGGVVVARRRDRGYARVSAHAAADRARRRRRRPPASPTRTPRCSRSTTTPRRSPRRR